jgi:hypothetical protein
MIKYRIPNWDESFEVAQSKKCDVMKWVPIPYNPSSYGLCALMDRPDGTEIYGIFIMLVMEASQSRVRGDLTRGRNQVPHDPRSLALKLRLKEAKVKTALQVLSSEEIGWVEAEVVSEEEQDELDLPIDNITGFPLTQELRDEIRGEDTPGDPEPERLAEEIATEAVLPAGWKRMSEKDAKVTRVKENTPLMVELGGLFNRRETTLWTVSETRALMALFPIEPDEYRAIRTYYRATIDKREDIRRRDLVTLLNNWPGEVDRATRRSNVATGGVEKREEKRRPMPDDFTTFLEEYNPTLVPRAKQAWGPLTKEYDDWKESNAGKA